MNNQNNFLITGIPRSGTTLLIHLIDKYTQSIVLTEPTWIKLLREESNDEPNNFLILMLDHIKEIRKKIKNNQEIEVLVDSRNNEVPQNFFIREQNKSKTSVKNIKKHTLKKLPQHFNNQQLFIKANTYFTAILKQIVENDSFSTTAVIRDPLATLKSWRSLDIPVSRGQLKIANLFSADVRNISKIDDLLIRQVKLLDWFYQQYHEFQDKINIIKYEDLVLEPQQIISRITKSDSTFSEELRSMNNSSHYNHTETEMLTTAIKTHASNYAYFYRLKNS